MISFSLMVNINEQYNLFWISSPNFSSHILFIYSFIYLCTYVLSFVFFLSVFLFFFVFVFVFCFVLFLYLLITSWNFLWCHVKYQQCVFCLIWFQRFLVFFVVCLLVFYSRYNFFLPVYQNQFSNWVSLVWILFVKPR